MDMGQRGTDVDHYDEKLARKMEPLFVRKIIPSNFLPVVHVHDEMVLTMDDLERFRKMDTTYTKKEVNLALLAHLICYNGWFSCVLNVCRDPDVKQADVAEEFERLKRGLDEELAQNQAGGEIEEVVPVMEAGYAGNNAENVQSPEDNVADDAAEADGSGCDLSEALQGLSLNPDYVMENGHGFCYICSVELTSEQLKDQHIKGKQHQKQLARHSAGGGPVSSKPETPTTTVPHRQSINASASRDEAPVAGSHDDYYLLPDGTGLCHICKVAFTSRENADQHLKGNPHRRKKDSLSALSIASSAPVGPNGEFYVMNENGQGYCYACALRLTSKEHADSHVNGRKHKNKCGGRN